MQGDGTNICISCPVDKHPGDRCILVAVTPLYKNTVCSRIQATDLEFAFVMAGCWSGKARVGGTERFDELVRALRPDQPLDLACGMRAEGMQDRTENVLSVAGMHDRVFEVEIKENL